MRTVQNAAGAVVALVTLAGAGAAAQDVPAYDSVAHCERIRYELATSDDQVHARCLWVEDYARNELEAFWPAASADIRGSCIDSAAVQESYAELAVCVLGRLREARRRP